MFDDFALWLTQSSQSNEWTFMNFIICVDSGKESRDYML